MIMELEIFAMGLFLGSACTAIFFTIFSSVREQIETKKFEDAIIEFADREDDDTPLH